LQKDGSSGGGGGSGSGGLTITGILAKYNGKYFYGSIGSYILSDKTPETPLTPYGKKISGGKVTTSVWEINMAATSAANAYKEYTGSGQNLTLNIIIGTASEGVGIMSGTVRATVSFTNGKASVDVSDASWMDYDPN
jgi:hypothetical protein